jgi:hypothetical protein
MNDQSAQQVRRVAVTDPIATARRYDYADAFEVRLPEPDPHSPETWVRAGLQATPGLVKRIVSLLGVRRAPQSSADSLGSWRVVESSPEVIHLETSLPLMHVIFVGRRAEPTRRTLTTVLNYERPVLARIVWAVVGVAHRRTARQVITGKISTTESERGCEVRTRIVN